MKKQFGWVVWSREGTTMILGGESICRVCSALPWNLEWMWLRVLVRVWRKWESSLSLIHFPDKFKIPTSMWLIFPAFQLLALLLTCRLSGLGLKSFLSLLLDSGKEVCVRLPVCTWGLSSFYLLDAAECGLIEMSPHGNEILLQAWSQTEARLTELRDGRFFPKSSLCQGDQGFTEGK